MIGPSAAMAKFEESDEDAGNNDGTIVVIIGRWILYWNGQWDFKIDLSRMGRSIKLSSIGSVDVLRSRVALLYGFQASPVSIELSYWIEDPIAELNGKGTQPVQIVCDKDVRVLKALHSADKSVNIFVTVRERVGESLVILGPKEGIAAEIMRRRDCPQISEGKRVGAERSANGVGVEMELTVDEIIVRDAEAFEADMERKAKSMRRRDCPQISEGKRGGEECSANGVGVERELTVEEIIVRDAEAFEADMERKAKSMRRRDCPPISEGKRGGEECSANGVGVERELTVEEIIVRDAEAFEADMERKAKMTAVETPGVRGIDSRSKTGKGVQVQTAKGPSEEVVVEGVDEKEKGPSEEVVVEGVDEKEKEENEEEEVEDTEDDEEDEDEDDEEDDYGSDNEGDGDTDGPDDDDDEPWHSDGVEYDWDRWDQFVRNDGKRSADDDDFVDEPPHFSSRYQSLPRSGKSAPSEGVIEDFNFHNTEDKAHQTPTNVTPPIVNPDAI
ncbi:unnamed protein product [Microthlaspi erraticum]|uniref:Uncharacterized protein n=1 Tax=Microthlaspi erraticum TaxID=1685480 RepID=A0A6D2IBL6_9BRAS|nr:unnamed protein product [Microthlaspi erraticum]